MKELIYYSSSERSESRSNVNSLTIRTFHPTLIVGGDIFMAEQGKVDAEQPGISTNSRPQKPVSFGNILSKDRENFVPQEQPNNPFPEEKRQGDVGEPKNVQGDSRQIIDKEKLRKEWYATFTREELKDADIGPTIEAVIGLGYGPLSVTSKGPIEFKAKDVISNSLLDDEQRLEKAEKLLEQSLSPEQQTAILKAHYASKGKIGKNGQEAGIYNLTEEQIAERARILKNEGRFTDEQRRIIIESGLAATAAVNPNADIDAAMGDIATVEFQSILERLRSASPSEIGGLYQEMHVTYRELFNRLYGERGSIAAQITGPQDPRHANIANIDEILARLPQERARIANLLIARESTRSARLSERQTRLLGDIDEKDAEIGAAPDEATREMLRSQRRIMIRDIVKSLPDPADEPIADDLIIAIAKDHATTQEFITKLILPELEDETYQMKGFYSSVNRDKFLRVSRLERLIIGDDRINLESLMAANETFHNMNYIMKRSFDQFVQQSQLLLPKHFNVLSRLPGVARATQVYEEFFHNEIGNRTRISEEELDAIEIKARSAFETEVKASVAIGTDEEKETKGIKGVYGSQLEDWEIDRALIYSRNFFRITRAPEIISNSELPMKSDPGMFVSAPMKELTQLLHPLRFIGFRFLPNISRGGPEMIQELLQRRIKARRGSAERARLKIVEGTDVDMRELKEVVSARMVFATWRNARAVLNQIKFGDGAKITDIKTFFLENREMIANFSSETKLIDGFAKKKRWKEAARVMGLTGSVDSEGIKDWKRNRVMSLFRPLIGNNSLALGLLLSGNSLPVPTELKEIIWEKVSFLDPLTMSSLLTRLEVDQEHSSVKEAREKNQPFQVKSLEEIIMDEWGDNHQGFDVMAARNLKGEIIGLKDDKRKAEGKKDTVEARRLSVEIDRLAVEYDEKDKELQEVLNDPRWRVLQDKLRFMNSIRIKRETDRLKRNSRDELNRRSSSNIKDFYDEVELGDDEKRVIVQIQANGQKIAPDLARIKQVDAWFLNDTPFEEIEWKNLGQYFDRETGDLAKFSQANGKYLAWLTDPFGQKVEEVIKEVGEGVQAAGDVLGLEPAQTNIKGLYDVYLDFIYEYPRYRQKIISALRQGAHKPTSRAQEFVGINAASIDEGTMYEVIEDSLHGKIFRLPGKYKDLDGFEQEWEGNFKEEEERLKLQWWRRIGWANFRDYGPFGLGAFFIEFFKEIFKDFSRER